jgi:uncharacterized membrane protein YphA (DoxX/SURF4 family)
MIVSDQQPMKKTAIHNILTVSIASVWILNGLYCKILNLVPRHEQIVASILGDDYARPLTVFIGLSEILLGIWVLTKFKAKLSAVIQICLVAIMNGLEFVLVPDLLLWGRFNVLFALLFIGLVYFHNFDLSNDITSE